MPRLRLLKNYQRDEVFEDYTPSRNWLSNESIIRSLTLEQLHQGLSHHKLFQELFTQEIYSRTVLGTESVPIYRPIRHYEEQDGRYRSLDKQTLKCSNRSPRPTIKALARKARKLVENGKISLDEIERLLKEIA